MHDGARIAVCVRPRVECNFRQLVGTDCMKMHEALRHQREHLRWRKEAEGIHEVAVRAALGESAEAPPLALTQSAVYHDDVRMTGLHRRAGLGEGRDRASPSSAPCHRAPAQLGYAQCDLHERPFVRIVRKRRETVHVASAEARIGQCVQYGLCGDLELTAVPDTAPASELALPGTDDTGLQEFAAQSSTVGTGPARGRRITRPLNAAVERPFSKASRPLTQTFRMPVDWACGCFVVA